MNQKSETGKIGEDIACEFLKKNGFSIIERNFRQKWGELDIVVKDQSGNIVFVEVKTIRQSGNSAISWIRPEDNLTGAKLKKLQRTASLYIGSHQDLLRSDAGWRIDLIAITITGDISSSTIGLTDIIKNCEIKHFENIF